MLPLTTPPTIYDYDMGSHDREFKKQTEVLGGFDSGNYQSRRLLAPRPGRNPGADIPAVPL